jgi:hypothetical protein
MASREKTAADPVAEAYKSVKSFADLLRMNAAYLKGQRTFTCYTYAPLQKETEPLVPALLELHARGILTMTSQPGTLRTAGSPKDQRSYLDFLCPVSPAALRLSPALFNDHRVYTFRAIPSAAASDAGEPNAAGASDNFPAARLPLTVEPDGKAPNTFWREAYLGESLHVTPGVEPADTIIWDLAAFTVAAKEMGPDTDVVAIVLEAAKKAGLEPDVEC